MASYTLYSRLRRWPKRILYTMIALVLISVTSVVVVRRVYDANLGPVSTSTEQIGFVVPSGASVNQIGNDLHKAGLIRQTWAFERYIRARNLGSKLQAGTYKFSPSQNVASIANMMAEGKVAVDLITLLPGQRIDQLKEAFIRAKFDSAAVDTAFDPAQYASSPALADKPANASLEGFLYPDSYQKDANTDPKVIVQAALDEMEQRLTPERRAAFAAHGLSVYQAVTMASIIEREVSNAGDRAQVAQVIYKRMASNMKLESDPTAYYGAIKDGRAPSLSYDSPYNTYKIQGLPVGPISNVSESSLDAVAHPADTDWLFFVAGDDGKTYFSKTLEEHQALTAAHCHKLCSQ
jgi:UPF0755 protein